MKIGIIAAALAFVGLSAVAQTNQKTNMDMKKLELVQENDRTDEQTQIENRPIGSFVAFEPGLQFIFHMYN